MFNPDAFTGYRTFVVDKPEGEREKQQALPAGSATTNSPRVADDGLRLLPQPQYNKPDEKSQVTDRPRTLGVPGGDDHPYKNDYGMPTRRVMTGYETRRPWQKQRRQSVSDRLEDHREYQQHKSTIKRDRKSRYRKIKNNPQFKHKKEQYAKHPLRYKRKMIARVAARYAAEIGLYDQRPPESSRAIQTETSGYLTNVSPGQWSFDPKQKDTPLSPPYAARATPPALQGGGSGKVTPDSLRQAATKSEILHNLNPSVKSRQIQVPTPIKENGVWIFKIGDYTVEVTDSVNVRVRCNCPFFRWQGPEYWAYTEGYLYGDPVGVMEPPKIRDPQGINRVCKHLYAVLGIV